MSELRIYAGTFLSYFVGFDALLPFTYVYGLRENAAGQIYIVRTGPVQELREDDRGLFSYGLYHQLGTMMTDQTEKALYRAMFDRRNLPIMDNEIVASPVIVTPQ
jgi:hypothetical protein